MGNFSIGIKLRIRKCVLPILNYRGWLNVYRYSTASIIRNIGILAHVDAGKTTTVERMLFYSGCIRCLGEVDKGSAVMDCLPIEKQRGITIKTSAIWFLWNGYRVNFIDTPGHADFVFEVERALTVMDGALVLLDAIAGVEAQTIHVWKRATDWKLPRLVFINKMDRPGADSSRTLAQLQHQLGIRPIAMQVPIFGNEFSTDGSFCGLIDIINMEILFWPSTGDGTSFTRKPLTIITDQELLKQAVAARTLLVETLAEIDETLIDAFLSSGSDLLQLDSNVLRQAVRRATLSNHLVPVFYGAALKNIGLQPLLDAIVTYFPSPVERLNILKRGVKPVDLNVTLDSPYQRSITGYHNAFLENFVLKKNESNSRNPSKDLYQKEKQSRNIPIEYLDDSLGSMVSFDHIKDTYVFAFVFKVVVEKAMKYVYISVRQGCLRKGQWLRIRRGGRIRVGQLREGLGGTAISGLDFSILPQLVAGASRINTGPLIDKIEAGNWGIMISDNEIRTGDMLLSDMDPIIPIKRNCAVNLENYYASDNLTGNEIDNEFYFGSGLPSPVVTVALEPIGTAAICPLSQALKWLLDEDPSLRVDDNDGQILLSGVGELHIAVACDRLRNHFCVDFRVGSIQLRRWEKVLREATLQQTYEASIHGKLVPVDITVRLVPINNQKKNKNCVDNEIVVSESVIASYTYFGVEKVRNACTSGVLAGLQCGPIEGFPICGAKVVVESADAHGATITASILGEAIRFTISHLISTLPKSSFSVIEPIMHVIVILPHEKDIGNVIKDLTGLRQGRLISMEGYPTGQYVVVAQVSLRYIVLRNITSGLGSFVMSLDHFGTYYLNDKY
ncbi:hypothetical protein PCANB_002354 [Pneumocystis canis]|nr:hypothetical protein PCANB_002354 [Pneumocystis canis]